MQQDSMMPTPDELRRAENGNPWAVLLVAVLTKKRIMINFDTWNLGFIYRRTWRRLYWLDGKPSPFAIETSERELMDIERGKL
jgi:hypothetical protein